MKTEGEIADRIHEVAGQHYDLEQKAETYSVSASSYIANGVEGVRLRTIHEVLEWVLDRPD